MRPGAARPITADWQRAPPSPSPRVLAKEPEPIAEPNDIPASIALIIGLAALAAGVGELRAPGGWRAMTGEFDASPALRLLAGLFCLATGAALYYVNPWQPGDWLALAVSVIGGLMVAQGLLLLASGTRLMRLARRATDGAGPLLAGASAVIGFAFIAAALARLQ